MKKKLGKKIQVYPGLLIEKAFLELAIRHLIFRLQSDLIYVAISNTR